MASRSWGLLSHLEPSGSRRAFNTLSKSTRSRSTKISKRKFHFEALLAEKDALLFTPGPLTTSPTVKQAALHDWGSRDKKMIDLIQSVRHELVSISEVSHDEYTSVLMQGSGTFGVESVITSCVPRGGKILVCVNGSYGARAKQIAMTAGIEAEHLEWKEDEIVDSAAVDQFLAAHPDVTTVLCVHSETTSGVVNPVEQVGQVCKKHGKTFIVDAMSSFGGIPLDMNKGGVDYMVSSSNKCLQGIPGFSFAVARKSAILKTKGWARSVSLDLHSQMAGLDKNGQFRFTPPCHSIIAFRQALDEFNTEGGVQARYQRYLKNKRICIERMNKMGFQTYLKPEIAGPIITSFRYPASENWDFEDFYRRLSERKFLIYPGKVSNADCFRIGHIGHIFPSDTSTLMDTVEEISVEMNLFGSEN